MPACSGSASRSLKFAIGKGEAHAAGELELRLRPIARDPRATGSPPDVVVKWRGQDAQDLFPAGVVDAPIPVPGPGQLLVCTEAVGVGVGLVRMLEAGDVVRPGRE